MNDINEAFKAAGQIRAQQIRDERERRENPRKATAENGDKFAAHIEQQMQARREESSIADLLN